MSALLQQVFISFSHANVEHADAIAELLAASGIPIWIDHTNLEPGSPDWEEAIREAMSQCSAVLYVASPEARQSRFVKGELALAAARKMRVFPVWVSGSDWHDCAPLELLHTQYIDVRDENDWDTATDALVRAMQAYRSKDLPDVFEIKPLWLKKESEVGTLAVQRFSPPSDFLQIDFSSKFVNVNAGLFFRARAFQDVGQLLDDVYLRYLSDRFEPFAYGQSWALATAGRYMQRLLVPGEISAVTSIQAVSEIVDAWRSTALPDAAFGEGDRLHVVRPDIANCLVVFALDDKLVDFMKRSSNPKQLWRLGRQGIIQEMPPEQPLPTDRNPCLFLPNRSWGFLRAGRYIQVKEFVR